MASPNLSDAYSPIQKWVDRLLLDVSSRGLKTGDTYLTTDQASALLGCGRATAYRAIKQLVQKGILGARRGSGTFIGPNAPTPNIQTSSIHILMPLGFEDSGAMPLIRLMQSVAKSLGGWGVHFDTFPQSSGLEYLREGLLKTYQSGQVGAVIAISCHWTVHQFLKEQGLNAIVLGSMFPERQFLPSIDKDSAQGGRLLVDYLIGKKHRNFAVLALASDLAGLDLFTDSISRSLSTHGIPADSLTLRYCNGDQSITEARLRELLNSSQRPTAIITDEEDLADLAAKAVKAAGLVLNQDVEIVFQGTLFRTGESAPYLHTCATISPEALTDLIVKMIQLPKSGNVDRCNPIFVPVKLADVEKFEVKTVFTT